MCGMKFGFGGICSYYNLIYNLNIFWTIVWMNALHLDTSTDLLRTSEH